VFGELKIEYIEDMCVIHLLISINFISIKFTYLPIFHPAGEVMRKIMSALIIALVVGSVFTLSVAGKETVRVSGSTTVLPLAEANAEAFNDASVRL
jgi:hypothetical protein